MPKLNDARRKAGVTKMGDSGETKAADLHHAPVVHHRVNADDIVGCAIDPGETHVGVAVGCRYFAETGTVYTKDGETNTWTLHQPGWRVYEVAEMTPPEFVRWFKANIDMFDFVTCEKFTLYPHLAKEQIGSEMPTSKLIGWIEFTVQLWNEDLTKNPKTPVFGYPEIEFTSYPANIHAGTSSIMKKRGIPFVSPLTPDHARSAELHFWHHLIRAQLVEGVVLA